MAVMIEQWRQSGIFNPTDPTQKKIERYTGVPGGYSSFYFDRVPITGNLKGPFTTAIGTGAGRISLSRTAAFTPAYPTPPAASI